MTKTETVAHYTVVPIPRMEFLQALGGNSDSVEELDEWLGLTEKGRLLLMCKGQVCRNCTHKASVKGRGR